MYVKKMGRPYVPPVQLRQVEVGRQPDALFTPVPPPDSDGHYFYWRVALPPLVARPFLKDKTLPKKAVPKALVY